MQNLSRPRTSSQPNLKSTYHRLQAVCLLLGGLVVAILGTGCETLPKYETPATQENVFERIKTRQDNVDRIRWHHHELNNQHFVRTRSIELYIGQSLDQPQTVWLRFRAHWMDRRWKFFNGITINTDGTRHDWNKLDFKRDLRSGSSSVYVYENLDIPIDTTKREVIEAIINAQSAVVRFRGERGVSDFNISPTDRLILQDILTAFDALQAGAQRPE